MIIAALKGRVGNQLFQVAYSYLLSKKFSHKLIVLPVSRFGFQLNCFNLPLFLNFIPYPYALVFYRFLNKVVRHRVVIHEDSCLIHHQVPEFVGDNIFVEGYFQDGRLLSKYRDELQQLFLIKASYRDRFNRDFGKFFRGKVLVVNIRLREYSNFHFSEIGSTPYISPDWYRSILKVLCLDDFVSCVVVSDDISQAKGFIGSIDPRFVFIDETWEVDFQFLINADVLIIPNSSFSWWGAFLNRKPNKVVYAPKNWVGVNVGFEYPLGIMVDDFNWV